MVNLLFHIVPTQTICICQLCLDFYRLMNSLMEFYNYIHNRLDIVILEKYTKKKNYLNSVKALLTLQN